MMKGICFTTPLVIAIDKDLKGKARRIIKDVPDFATIKAFGELPSFFYCVDGNQTEIKPKYKKGEIVYLKETWGNWSEDDPECNAVYNVYFADYENGAKGYWIDDEYEGKIWVDLPKRRSGRFMPMVAARTFLKITDVRVERIQDISEEDARREGAEKEFRTVLMRPDGGKDYHIPLSYKGGFVNLWESINAKRGYGWDTNPYVWVYTFEKVNKPV